MSERHFLSWLYLRYIGSYTLTIALFSDVVNISLRYNQSSNRSNEWQCFVIEKLHSVCLHSLVRLHLDFPDTRLENREQSRIFLG
jgi:hypothetical protein